MVKKNFQIGELAKVFGISIATLRIYDKKGILKPDIVQKNTGYRMYSVKQFGTLKFILYLKEMTFSLSEIKKLLANELDLKAKKKQLLKKINSMKQFISLYSKYSDSENYKVETKIITTHYAISKTMIFKNTEDVIKGFDELFTTIIKKKLKQPIHSNPYAIFHDKEFTFENFNCTIFAEVEKSDCPDVHKINEKKYITCIHRGSYDTLSKTYNYLYNYADTNNIKIVGEPLEKYLVSYGNKQFFPNYITEICLPIE